MTDNQIEILMPIIALSLFGWCFLGIFVFGTVSSSTEKLVRKRKASGELKPSSFLPLSRIREITHEDLISYFIYTSVVQDIINKGNTKYSSLEATGMFNSLKMYTSVVYFRKHHKILATGIVLMTFPLGFIPLFIAILALNLHFKQASKAEIAVNEYLYGTLSNKMPGNTIVSNGISDELKKLLDLKQSGALSDQEFTTLKERLLKAG